MCVFKIKYKMNIICTTLTYLKRKGLINRYRYFIIIALSYKIIILCISDFKYCSQNVHMQFISKSNS